MKTLLTIAGILLYLNCFSQSKDVSKQLLDKASREESNKDYENAILDYSKVIEISPNDPWWWMARGQARFKNKDTVGALYDLNKAVQIDTNFSYGYFQLGYAKLKSGDKEGSEWDYHKSTDLQKPFFDKARTEFKKGDFKHALKDFNIALTLHPKDADIYFEMAITERCLKDTWDCEIYLKKAIELYNGL